MGVDEPGLPTLYEWAGGLPPLRRMIDCFYDRVEADDVLAGFFPGGVSQRHRSHVTADLPADAEFRAAIIGYLEWGTRLAMDNSRPGAPVVEHAPTPRWGWGVAPPYQG
jgi:hemoglobin